MPKDRARGDDVSKKKPAKKKPPMPDDLRSACEDIVDQLFAEVDRVNGARMDEMNASILALKASARDVLERIEAVEAKVACRSRRPFGGWLCLPWCR